MPRSLSKAVTAALRHGAGLRKRGREISGDGWLAVTSLRSLRALRAASDQQLQRWLEAGVERWEVCTDPANGSHWARALQGHSLPDLKSVGWTMELDDLPEVLYHGARVELVDSIMTSGLKPGGGTTGRLHVHLRAQQARLKGKHTSHLAVYLRSASHAVALHLRAG